MKVTAYSIKACEKEFITRANNKKHDITMISNRLTVDTVSYAKGKEAILVFPGDDLSEQILLDLKLMGVKYIVTRSTSTDHIDLRTAKSLGILVANIPSYSPESVAEHALTLMLALSRNILPAHHQMMKYDFTLDRLIGTTIRNKTVGVVGFGQTGQAVVEILRGFGCRILVSDIKDYTVECEASGAEQVELGVLFKESDIITFHVPLTNDTRHMVNAQSITKMKDGVMLINVSRGAVFKSIDVYNALQSEKISKLGMDVYEFENHVFYFDHTSRPVDDQLLTSLIEHPNVLLTPHEAFLTKEALEVVAKHTIENLNQFLGEGGTS
ncbi:MAG: NAD(P)-dependent oxidoreductase [Bacteroidota bacterium]